MLKKIVLSLILISLTFGTVAPAISYAQATPTPATVTNDGKASTDAKSGTGCGWMGIGGDFNKCIKYAIASVSATLLTFTALVLQMGGLALDTSIEYSIMRTKELVDAIPSINSIWTMFRDLANLTFIFILLYAAIGQILQLTGINMKKIVMSVVMVGIFINFSMFATKVVIDVSNLLTLTIYSQMSVTEEEWVLETTGNSVSEKYVRSKPAELSISKAFMGAMKLTTVFQNNGNMFEQLSEIDDFSDIIFAGILGSIFFLVAAFVFFSAAILFILRFVFVIILIATSSIAVGSLVMGNQKGMFGIWEKWWGQLKTIAIFPVVYMLLILASLQVANNFFSNAKFGSDAGFAAVFRDPNGGTITVIINFVVIIALLIFSLLSAIKLGQALGGVALGANKLRGWGGKLAGKTFIGGTGWLGRNTIGRGMSFASEKLKQSAGTNMAARLAFKATKGIGDKSFDFRNTSAGKALDKKIGGLGTAVKGGYEKVISEKAKSESEFIKSLKPTDYTVLSLKDKEDKAKQRKGMAEKALIEVIQKQKAAEISDNDIMLARRGITLNEQVILNKRNEKIQLEKQFSETGDPIEKAKIQKEINTVKNTLDEAERQKNIAQHNYKTAKDKIVAKFKNEVFNAQQELKDSNSRFEQARRERINIAGYDDKDKEIKDIKNAAIKEAIEDGAIKNRDEWDDKVKSEKGFKKKYEDRAKEKIKGTVGYGKLVSEAADSLKKLSLTNPRGRRIRLERADAVRKLSKSKTKEQTLADAVKKMTDDEKEEESGGKPDVKKDEKTAEAKPGEDTAGTK